MSSRLATHNLFSVDVNCIHMKFNELKSRMQQCDQKKLRKKMKPLFNVSNNFAINYYLEIYSPGVEEVHHVQFAVG